MALRRALHFVFKIGDRAKTATFYRDVLGMKVGVFDVNLTVRTETIQLTHQLMYSSNQKKSVTLLVKVFFLL